MSFQLSFSIEGEKQLSRRLRDVQDGVQNMKPTFKKTAKTLRKVFERDSFNTRGAEIGVKWEPLSPAYAEWKRQNFGNKPILVRTGKMKGNFKTDYGRDFAQIWNPTEYFKYHQSKKSRGRLPRRQMMRLGNLQRALVVKLFQDTLRKL